MLSPTRQFFYDIRSGMSRQQAFNRFRQSIYRKIATRKIQQNPRPVQGPTLSTGKFYSKPQPTGPPKSEGYPDPLVGHKWTVGAWQQKTQTHYQQVLKTYKSIGTYDTYIYEGKQISGKKLKEILKPKVELAKQQFHQALEMEKGYTIITKTDEGFTIETDYKKLLREDPGRAAALGWSWGGLGNIDIAYYKLTGQHEKAEARQVEQIKNVMYAKQKLAEGDIKEFSIQYWSGYLSSPATQIGFAYGAGLGIGALSKVATPVIAAKGVGTQLAIRGGTLAAGATLGGYLAYHVAEPGFTRGDWGQTLGRGWVTGTGVIAGAAGYRAAFKTGAEYKSFMMQRAERPTFIKEFVKAAPSTYDKLVHKIPGIGPMGYLKGPGVQPKPFGFGRTGGFIYKGTQKLGQTKFWQNIYGWAAKGYVPSQTYYLYQEGVYDDAGYRIQPTLWKRKSWLEKSWIPKEKAESFKSFVGKSGDIEINFPTSKYYSGGEINIRGITEGKVVRFGRGWFRHTYISSEAEKSIMAYTKTGRIDIGGFGSYKRGSGIVDIIPDYSPPPTRPERFLGKLLKYGYWGKSKPHYIDVKGTIEGGPDWISGFGATRPKTSYHLLTHPDKWKQLPAGIIRDIRASMGISKLRTDQLLVSPGEKFSALGRQFMNVPISGKFPRMPLIGVGYSVDLKPIQISELKPRLEIPEIVSSIPKQEQIKIPIQEQIRIPIQMQSKIPIQEQIRIPIQIQTQTPIQTQTHIQKLIETPIETVTTTIKTPTIKTPNINVTLTPPTVPEFDEWDKRKPKFDKMAFDLFPGYRWREWKTPRLQDVLKI